MPTPLADLIDSDGFVARHIGPDSDAIGHMLEVLGVESTDALLAETVPSSVRSDEPLADVLLRFLALRARRATAGVA